MEVVVKCEWCGQPMQTTDLRRRYHKVNKDGTFCSHEARLECKRNHERTRRQNGYTKPRNGTGLLGPHTTGDVEVEAVMIRKEKRWLRLKVL